MMVEVSPADCFALAKIFATGHIYWRRSRAFCCTISCVFVKHLCYNLERARLYVAFFKKLGVFVSRRRRWSAPLCATNFVNVRNKSLHTTCEIVGFISSIVTSKFYELMVPILQGYSTNFVFWKHCLISSPMIRYNPLKISWRVHSTLFPSSWAF